MVLTPLFSVQSQKSKGRGSNSLRDDHDEEQDEMDFSKIGSETVSPTIRRRKSPLSSSSSDSYPDGFGMGSNQSSTSPSDCSSESCDYDNGLGVILQKYDKNTKQTTSALHTALKEAKTMEELEPIIPLITATAASYADPFGRNALHIFAENGELFQTPYHNQLSISPTSTTADSSPLNLPPSLSARSGSVGSHLSGPLHQGSFSGDDIAPLINFVVSILWPAYHASLITTDKKGYIPFEEAIRDWVESVYDRSSRRPTNSSGHASVSIPSIGLNTKVPLPSILDINATIRWRNGCGSSCSEKESEINITSQDGNNIETVAGGSDVESGFRSIRVVELHRDKVFPERVRMSHHAWYSLQMLSSLLDVMIELTNSPSSKPRRRSKSRKRNLQDDLRTTTLNDMRDALVQTVASIPDFVKLILIIQDEEQREKILKMTLVKYVLIHKASVGTWLTGMLQSKSRVVTDISIHYLHLVSTLTIVDEDDDQNQAILIGKVQEEMRLRDEFYQEASRLEDFVPSLLSMGEEQIEEAATTKVVQQVLDRIISRPFAVTVVFCDAIFLALFIFGFRGAVNRAVLGGSSATILTYLHLANTGIFYFLIRETGKGISLCMVTRKARTYFVSFWNLIDLGTIVLGLVSTVAIRSQSFDGLRSLCAVTTGLLWLRVLSYLKGINMQLATFVLAILQITRDILWFCVILFIVVVLFSQMFFTLLAPDSCSAADMQGNKECSQNEYYLKVYAILLGDFGLFQRESFASMFSVVLIVLYTFLVVLVLLNVLIAVASDSYEKCLLRSQNLFGRARVMMIAELVSFQQLLHRNSQQGVTSSSTSDLGLLSNSWWSSDSWINGWSRGSLVFFTLSFLIFFVWTIGELAGYFAGPQLGNAWLSFGSIFVNVGLYVGVMFFLASGATDRANMKDSENQSPMFFFRWYGQYFQQMMVRVLGSSGGTAAQDGGDLWKGRLVFLQSEMSKIAQDTKTECKDMLRGVETSVVKSENQLRHEVSMLEKNLTAFIEEQRQTNARINEILDKRRL